MREIHINKKYKPETRGRKKSKYPRDFLISTYISKELQVKLKEAAKFYKTSIAGLMRDMVEDYLDEVFM